MSPACTYHPESSRGVRIAEDLSQKGLGGRDLAPNLESRIVHHDCGKYDHTNLPKDGFIYGIDMGTMDCGMKLRHKTCALEMKNICSGVN